MYLLLDNSNTEQIVLNLWLNNIWVQHIYQPSECNLLVAIDKCLQVENIVLKDISGIAVVVGKGSFTSTRIAVTIANTLAYSLDIPVAGVNSVEEPDLIAKLENTKKGVLVSAVYSGEPNIGKKRI